jgi:hypothetical protein
MTGLAAPYGDDAIAVVKARSHSVAEAPGRDHDSFHRWVNCRWPISNPPKPAA